MTFREWCQQYWGLVNFTEGKIQNSVLIPALPGVLMSLSREMAQYGGYLIDSVYVRALILSANNYIKLKAWLKHDEYTNTECVDDNLNNRVIESYFSQYGFNINNEREYREPAYIDFYFEDVEKQQVFLTQFACLNPLITLSPLTATRVIQFPSYAIQYLLGMYYDNVQLDINSSTLGQIQTHKNALNQLLTNIEQYHLRPRLDYALFLSLDYTNNIKNGLSFHSLHATSAYNLSLKIYAEINRDNLSLDDYSKLNYAATLLAAYDEAGHLQQSLKTDDKFARDMAALFYSLQVPGELIPIRQLPPLSCAKVMTFIEQDILGSLYGNPHVSLGKNAYFCKARFLPDAKMQSDTDELILSGGGRAGHFAVYRIIKVGFLANGLKAGMREPVHFYKYYKVDNNLGRGAHGINDDDTTCYGTYITELSPYALVNELFIPMPIDPHIYPGQYQAAMAFTLFELIRAERELLLYQESNLHINAEATEWQRLNAIAVTLRGSPVNEALEYVGLDPFDADSLYERRVCNLREYMQEGGSCLIFSLKCLVASVIGPRLTTLHINFMQLNNASMCIDAVESKIKQLNLWQALGQDDSSANNAMSIDEPTSLATNQFSFFVNNYQNKEGIIKDIQLSQDETICLITQIDDAVTNEISFELVCSCGDSANELQLLIIDALPEDLFISRDNNVIELSLYCMQKLCDLCNIAFEHLTNIAVIKTINLDASSSSSLEY